MAEGKGGSGSSKRTGSRGGGRKEEIPTATDDQGRLSVLVELRLPPGGSASFAMSEATRMDVSGFDLDPEFDPVPMGGGAAGLGMAGVGETVVVRGTVTGDEELAALRARPDVADVWLDTPIAPFQAAGDEEGPDLQLVEEDAAMGSCPIPPCDCDSGTPKGTIADVATYLGVNNIWSAGFRGAGIVVGVVDGGITAQGRPIKPDETPRRIGRVIGGWPAADWGTEARTGGWKEHGNMCATDVLGMAPDAQLYDLRIVGGGGVSSLISRAVQAFQWAIDRHRTDGTPHVLSNSWGIFQEAWDTTYARNPNHPFTRKVVEAINEGILVLFAAGNCGDTCPAGKCASDTGPGKSIWGANGHSLAMTVGAVNKNEQFIGYSSQGPAALDPNKPDFCSISHFTGYFDSDTGTSAATPILAGVVALLKQAKPTASQAEIKNCLRSTAKNIGAPGFDQHSGAGIVQAQAAFNCVRPPVVLRTRSPQLCVMEPPVTTTPGCFIRQTRTPGCWIEPLRTSTPGCSVPVTRTPPCFIRVTSPPACQPITIACPRVTMACGIPRPGLGDEDFADPYAGAGEYWGDPYTQPTVGPPCIPTVNPPCGPPPSAFPGCPPPPTFACGQTMVPWCRPTVAGCPPPTSPPVCRPTLSPQCPPTSPPRCPPTGTPPCGTPTLTPPCGAPTAAPSCPPWTEFPRCTPPTVRPRCGLPPTVRCQPPPTLLAPCGMRTLPPGCGPRPTLACSLPNQGAELGFEDPSAGAGAEHWQQEDPYGTGYGYPGAGEYYGEDPSTAMYGHGWEDPYGATAGFGDAGEYWHGYGDPYAGGDPA